MTNDLEALADRLEKTSAKLCAAINEFEHAIADSQRRETASMVASAIGRCYSDFDRLNSMAVSRLAHFDVEKMLSVKR